MANMREKVIHIADHYGYKKQTRQLGEEMAELTIAISKYERAKEDNTPYDFDALKKDIAEEIADVEVVLEQLKYLLECDWEVFKIKLTKVDRQIARIKDEYTM